MIEQAEKKETRFLEILHENPVFGVRIETLYACYKNYASLCSFYIIDGKAAMSVTGKVAMIAGEVRDKKELAQFFDFFGIQEIETVDLKMTGYAKEYFEVLLYTGITQEEYKNIPVDKNPAPLKLWELLHAVGAPVGKDNFYADYCMRRNKGLAMAYVVQQDAQYVATAGVYSMNEKEAYISFVATLEAYRHSGYASALCHMLAQDLKDKQVYIACEKELKKLYEKAGFAPFMRMVRLTRKETE